MADDDKKDVMGDLAAQDAYDFSPVDVPIPTPRPNLLEQARQEYPVLNNYDIGYKESPGKGQGYMESFPPGEPGSPQNPRPSEFPLQQFGVENYRPDSKASDVMADITSHHLVNVDPTVKQTYQGFAASLQPFQHDILVQQYQHAVQNEGETRPFEQWRDAAGLPGMFRGYAFDQWPKEFTDQAYTPQQKQQLNDMVKYLKGTRSDLSPDETQMQPPQNAVGGLTPEDWMMSGQQPPAATYDYVPPQSWLQKAGDLARRDVATYQQGGVPAMMGQLAEDSSGEQDLAGGFSAGGTIKGVKPGSILRPDPLWSPISKTKLEKPLSEMEHGYTDQRFPVPQIVDPQKLQGGYGVFTPSDLSRGNVTVNKIDTVPIDPVTAHGGVSFPEANPGMAWASETPIARKLDNQAAALAEKGKPVYIMPMTMSPQGIDASHHVASPLAQLVQAAPIAKTNVEKFDRMMRKVDENWPGIKDEDFPEYIDNLQGGMKIKAYMANRMALGAWQDKGFPNVAAVRHAMSEPSLIDMPRNTTGMAISRYTPGQGLLETSHPSYSKGVAGDYMGQLASLLPFDVAAPTISRGLARVNAQNLAAGKEVAITPRYHLEKPTPGVPTHQEFNQQWLDRVMEQERKLARGDQ